MKARMTACFVALLAMLSLIAVSGMAEGAQGMGPTSGSCGRYVEWALDGDGTLTITGTGKMSDYDTATGTPWEARKNTIKKVVVGDGVTSVGNCSLYGCGSLAAVELPGSVKTVGDNAFYNCDGLTGIALPEGMTGMGQSAFYDCDGLRSIALPSTLESIGAYAFYSCNVSVQFDMREMYNV